MNEENILMQAGLSEEQALIYQSLIEKGPQRATSISQWTGIKRGLTYKVLEQLESMGLVSKQGNTGSVATFSPLHPSLLLHNFERKEKELALTKELLTHSLGALASQFNLMTGKPNVQFYEGTDAIKKITGDLPQNDKEIRQFLDISQALEQFPKDTIIHLNARVDKGIAKRMILPENSSNNEYAKKGTPLTEFRIVKNMSTFPTAIQIYDHKVSMLTLTQNKRIGLIIEDAEIASTLKIIFDGYWNAVAKPIDPSSA